MWRPGIQYSVEPQKAVCGVVWGHVWFSVFRVWGHVWFRGGVWGHVWFSVVRVLCLVWFRGGARGGGGNVLRVLMRVHTGRSPITVLAGYQRLRLASRSPRTLSCQENIINATDGETIAPRASRLKNMVPGDHHEI